MPGSFLNAAERERLNRFPREMTEADLISFFTLSDADHVQIPITSAPQNRLGFALQLGTLRYLGFCPTDLATIPPPAVAYVASRLDLDPSVLSAYGKRSHTRTDHLRRIFAYLGFHQAGRKERRALQQWLTERALEHDRPTLLLQLACEKLRQERILRPTVIGLERLVTAARGAARRETFHRISRILDDHTKLCLIECSSRRNPGDAHSWRGCNRTRQPTHQGRSSRP